MSLLVLTLVFSLVPLMAYSEVVADSDSSSDVLLLEPVEITVTRGRQAASDSAAAVTVLDVPTFGSSRGSLGELLWGVPGVTINGSGRLVGEQPNIRGMSGDRIVIRLDGARKNFSNVHRGRFFIDTEMVKQVEVLRGPGSSYHGSGAIGGVIQLETKSASDFLRRGERYGATVKTVYDSNDDRRRGYLHSYGRVTDAIDVLVSVGWQRSHNYADGDNSVIPASGNRIFNGLFKSTIALPDSHDLDLSLQRWEDDSNSYTTPELDPSDPMNTSILEVKRRTRDDTVSLRHRSQAGRGEIEWDNQLYYSRTEVREDGVHAGSRTTEDIRARRQERGISGMGASIGGSMRLGRYNTPSGAHTLRAGFDVYREEQDGEQSGLQRETDPRTGEVTTEPYRNDIPYPDAEQTLWGIYLNDSATWLDGRLKGEVALRLDIYDQQANQETLQDNSETSFSPRASVLYRLGKGIATYGAYSEAFRAPSLTELYSNDVHIAGVVRPIFTEIRVPAAVQVPLTLPVIDPRDGLQVTDPRTGRLVTMPVIWSLPENRFIVNEDLKPEKARSLEGGFTYDRRGVFVSEDYLHGRILYFYTRYTDFIEQFVTRTPCLNVAYDDGNDTPTCGSLYPEDNATEIFNLASAEVSGVELSLVYQNRDVYFSFAASRLRGEDRNTDLPLNSIPADRIDIGIEYRLSGDFYVGWRSQLVAAQNRFGGGVERVVNASTFAGTGPTPGYAVHDMYFRWSLGVQKSSMMGIYIDNFFDKAYRPHTANYNAQGLNLRLGWQRAF
ncbi:MAG: TonB-dependent receptor [Alphaproteobacteria bacterium GM202ARS2]|nr:TonB-dependent receptor [Alphaproteobacteria bacterium GM202ARS2]